jgi:hypothetical protein
LLSNDLGGSVVDAATGSLEQSSILHEVGQSEIHNFDYAICIDEYILGFKVSVRNQVAVGIGQSLNELPEEELGLIF